MILGWFVAGKLQVRRETHQLPKLELRGSFVPGSIDEERRTVEVVWTTGARVKRGFWTTFWEELSLDPAHVRMGRLQGGAPLLNAHSGWDANSVIGVVESARLERDKGVAVVRFAKAEDDPDAEKIFRKIADGILRDISVGYQTHKAERMEDAGEGEDRTPVYRAVDWEPYEISIVPMGADPGGKIRSTAGETYPCVFFDQRNTTMTRKKPIAAAATAVAAATMAARGEATEAPADEPAEEATEETQEETTTEETPAAAPPAEDAQRAVQREQQRVLGIQRAATALGLPAQFGERHIKGNTPLDRFRALAIDERGKPGNDTMPVRVTAVEGGDVRDKWLRGAEMAILLRSGRGDLVVRAAAKRGETLRLDAGEFRGLSFLDLARQCLERVGIRSAGLSKLDTVGRALALRDIGGLHTTSDFTVLLANSLHKILLASYELAPDTWRLWCGIGSVSDFRAHKRYRMGTIGVLQTVLEHGEYESLEIPDAEMESLTAQTKGGIIGISRQTLVNDDMDAFSKLAFMVGRAAALTIEAGAYATLLLNSGLGPDMEDGNPLFDATHSNISGSGTTLGVAGLDEDRQVMGQQLDPAGNEYLDLRPHTLLVPLSLGGQARVINASEFDVDSVTTNVTNKFMVPNKVRGLFQNVVDTPRLTGTRRYLFADPAYMPAIEVAFLEGQQSPYLEMKEGWRVDGVEWKARIDFAIGGVDFRTAVTNDGTP